MSTGRSKSSRQPNRNISTQYSRVSVRDLHFALETQIGDDAAALVLDHIGTVHALKRGLGLFIAEGGRALIISLGGALVFRAAASALGEGIGRASCRERV